MLNCILKAFVIYCYNNTSIQPTPLCTVGYTQLHTYMPKIIWCGGSLPMTVISFNRRMCLPGLMNFDHRLWELWLRMLWLIFMGHGACLYISWSSKNVRYNAKLFSRKTSLFHDLTLPFVIFNYCKYYF